MAHPIIVTRPAHDADVWVAKLQQSGLQAQALPLIEISAVSQPADVMALQKACNSLSDYTACMFVSGNAVEHFFSLFLGLKVAVAQSIRARAAPDNIAFKQLDALKFLAPGPGTVAALLAAGVPASQIDAPPLDAAQFDSEALWQVIGQRDWRSAKVLIVRGKGDALDASAGTGRDWLTQQWRSRGASVDVVSSYERRAPQLSIAQIELAKAASQDGSVWLFSSSEAVANLTSQPGLKDVDWQSALAIATHPRIQAAVQAAGWGVVQPSRPALADIVDALASIESKQP
jgi:uroporphyrinogen-III synthase